MRQQRRTKQSFLSMELPRWGTGKVDSRISTVAAVEKALTTRAGIEFLPSDMKGEGLRLRNPKA
jgi:hypothetical protein